MKKIIYLKQEVKLGERIMYQGLEVEVTQALVDSNPEVFKVIDESQELLDKAKRDYPVGTVFDNGRGLGCQKVVKSKPFWHDDSICIPTNKCIGGGIIYNGLWAEILPLKFTTEDDVKIYGDMKTYGVIKKNLSLGSPSVYDGTCEDQIKYFYHKENALDYIEKYKEKGLEDYEDMLYPNVWNWIKSHEPKLYYTKVLQLIADDLNDGYKPHFDNHTSYHLSDRLGGINTHCGGDEGCVYFKSIKLAEKAKSILGDKVKYLFN